MSRYKCLDCRFKDDDVQKSVRIDLKDTRIEERIIIIIINLSDNPKVLPRNGLNILDSFLLSARCNRNKILFSRNAFPRQFTRRNNSFDTLVRSNIRKNYYSEEFVASGLLA